MKRWLKLHFVFLIPFVGFFWAVTRFEKAYKRHDKACKKYMNDAGPFDATWSAFDQLFKEWGNATVALASTIIGTLILKIIL